MEGYLFKYVNMILGWRPRYFILSKTTLEIKQKKEDANGKRYDITSMNIFNEKKTEFSLEFRDRKILLKAFSEIEKATWLLAIKEQQHQILIGLQNQTCNLSSMFSSKNARSSRKESEKKDCNPYKKDFKTHIRDSLTSIQYSIFDLNIAINNLHLYLQENLKNEQLLKIYDSFLFVKQSLRSSIDDALLSIVDDEVEDENSLEKTHLFYEAKETLMDYPVDIKKENNNLEKNIAQADDKSDESASFDDCEEIGKFDTEEDKNVESLRLSRSGSRLDNIALFADRLKLCERYFKFQPRVALPNQIKSSNNMISDLVKAAMKEKAALPITYNEPISMLQRQIEPFQNYHLLDESFKCQEEELKIANISAYIVSELSLSINRLLKPFNPILGETFEFVDCKNQFRAISEQVSHHPPVSAYLIEGKNIFAYGDSKNKHKFVFLKGAIEMNFNSKANIIFHQSTTYHETFYDESMKVKPNSILNHYQYNKPNLIMKGLVYGTPHYDIVGVVNIEDLIIEGKNDICKAELEFLEEGKILGAVKGKIYKNKEVVYILKGNWREDLNLYDKSGKELIRQLWKVPNEPFIINQDVLNNYLLSSYGNNLNYLPEELLEVLPPSDSRLRPDQRLLEEGKFDEAEAMKKQLEDVQRKRAKVYEAEKKTYKPYFFKSLNDKDGGFYVPSAINYWEERENKNLGFIHDIFNTNLA